MLVVAAAGFIMVNKPYRQDSAYIQHWFWTNKTYPYKKFDIIIYGDSRVYRGINPAKFSKYFPSADIINLGYSSGGINKEMLEFAVSHFSKKDKTKILLLGITPFSLTEKARENKQFHQEYYRSKGEIIERKFIYPFLTAFEPIDINPYKKQKNYVQFFTAEGWVKSFKIQEDTTQAIASYIKQFGETQISSSSLEELAGFLAYARKNNIMVFGFRPPATYSLEQVERKYSTFDEQKIKQLFYSNQAVWIDIPNRYEYHSYDGSHLHFESANKLSVYLAEKIKGVMDKKEAENL